MNTNKNAMWKVVVYQAEEQVSGEYDILADTLDEAIKEAQDVLKEYDVDSYYDTEVAIYPYCKNNKIPMLGWYDEDILYPYNDYRVWKRDNDGNWCLFRQHVNDGARFYTYLDTDERIVVGDKVTALGSDEILMVFNIDKQDSNGEGDYIYWTVSEGGDEESYYGDELYKE